MTTPERLTAEEIQAIKYRLDELYSISPDTGYELLSHIDALAAENARLREACQLVSDFWNPHHPSYESDDWQKLIDEFVDKCRNALAPPEPETTT